MPGKTADKTAAKSAEGGRQEIPANENFRLDNVLVKNLSLEMPKDVLAPQFGGAPAVQLEMRNSSRALSRDHYAEVVLEATVKVLNGDKLQLLLEISQAGIFCIEAAEAEKRLEALNVQAPELLYPYLTHLISDLLQRAGAPRIFLPPFDFRNVYLRKKELMEQKLAADGARNKAVN